MEPRQQWRGNANHAQPRQLRIPPGFNGAAPMMARKLAAAHETAIAQNEASMEPRQ